MHDSATSSIGHFGNADSLGYTDFPNADVFPYTRYQVTLLCMVSDLIREVFSIGKLSKFKAADESFWLSLESSNTVSCVPGRDRLTLLVY